MTAPRDMSSVNKKIRDEIDKLDAPAKIKQLLRDILDVELDNMDKEEVRFINLYAELFA
jgi:hypothetical protein